MKTLRLLLLAALLSPGSWLLTPRALGATITGLIQDTTGTGVATNRVMFQPLNRPGVSGGALLTSLSKFTTTDTNGNFTLALTPGDYTVIVGNRDRFTISVPNDSSTYSLVDLITSNLQYAYTVPPSAYPVAATTRTGTVRTDTTVVDPAVYLSSTVDTLLAAVNTRATNAIANTNGVAYTGLTVDGLLFNRTNQLCRDAVAGNFLALTNALRDSYGNLTNARVTWVDGKSGILTAAGTSLGLTNLAVTYINGSVTNTVTISTISRNTDGSPSWSSTPTFN